MVGTTRPPVSFFMNRFRDLGLIEYIEYKGRIRVHKSLLNVILHDNFSEQNSSPTPDHPPSPARSARRAKRA
jgi:hypothetical protein